MRKQRAATSWCPRPADRSIAGHYKELRLSAESRHFYGTCKRKKRYGSLPDAMRAKIGTKGLSPYRCEFCSGWHLGHKTAMDTKLGADTVNREAVAVGALEGKISRPSRAKA